LDRRLGGPQSHSGRGGEEKNFQPLPGLEPHCEKMAVTYMTFRQCAVIEFLVKEGNSAAAIYK
jgi:hypothetical protein